MIKRALVYVDAHPRAPKKQTHLYETLDRCVALAIGPCAHSESIDTLEWLGTSTHP